jgi:hypothetical protein
MSAPGNRDSPLWLITWRALLLVRVTDAAVTAGRHVPRSRELARLGRGRL